MARITRSHRVLVAEDNIDLAIQIPLPETPAHNRGPLLEINNVQEEIVTVDELDIEQQLKELKAGYKNSLGVKKGKKVRKARQKKDENQTSTEPQVVIDDQIPVSSSPATLEARSLLDPDRESLQVLVDGTSASSVADLSSTVHEEQRISSTSPVINETRKLLNNTCGGQSGVTNLPPSTTTRPFVRPHLSNIHFYYGIEPPDEGLSKFWAATLAKTGLQKANMGSKGAEKFNTDRQNTHPPTDVMLDNKILDDTETLDQAQPSRENDTCMVDDDSSTPQASVQAPTESASRIEDSVEALDNLEEALEEAAQVEKMIADNDLKQTPISASTNMPATLKDLITRKMAGTTEKDGKVGRASSSKTLGRTSINLAVAKTNTVKKVKSTSDLVPSNRLGIVSPTDVKLAAKKQAREEEAAATTTAPSAIAKKLTRRPSSLLPSKQQVKSSKAPTRAEFELPGAALALRLKEQREARQAQREAVGKLTKPSSSRLSIIKSTKAPTVPTSRELPGEAHSRRKREAHEARLKAQEAEERKRREFKAKPARHSLKPSTIPRETLASLARKSAIGIAESDTVASGSTSSRNSIAKRSSTIGANRQSILSVNKANVSAPRSPGSTAANTSRKVSATERPSGATAASQAPKHTSLTADQKQRVKEIYTRDMKAHEDVEREKKEREAAAAKSRKEAAERGRQASKEWAEKQRARKATAPDEGLQPGFGPGGQLGLKA